MTFPIIFYVIGFGRLKLSNATRCGLVLLALFSSLSAGAFLALAVQLSLIVWDFRTRRLAHRWWILGGIVVAAFVVVNILSHRTPFEVFISYLTFNEGSSYNRVLIWTYGTQEVLNHPIFGIGYHDWERPYWMGDSVDNLWLLFAMRYGVPGIALLVLAIAAAFRNMAAGPGVKETALYRKALLVSFVGTCFAAATVDLWNGSYTLFMFLLGAGAWIADGKSGADRLEADPGPRGLAAIRRAAVAQALIADADPEAEPLSPYTRKHPRPPHTSSGR
jgi:O-antigen ligase